MLIENAAVLETLESVEDTWSEALTMFNAAELPFVIYIMTDASRDRLDLRTNIPQLYAATDPARDPFLDYCCESYEATRTGIEHLPEHEYLPQEAQVFIRGAQSVGFRSGFGIPTRVQGASRFGGFNVGTPLGKAAFEKKFSDKLTDIQAFCLLLHRRLEELGANRQSAIQLLSPREREILTLICNGESRKEAAHALGISPNTVAEYTKSAYRKLQVRNRAEAARAIFGT